MGFHARPSEKGLALSFTRTAVVIVAAVAALMIAPAASAVADGPPTTVRATTTNAPYTCRTPSGGEWVPVPNHVRQYTGSAPAKVRVGVPFRVTVDPAPATTNASYIDTIKDVQVALRLPANARLLAYSLSGGSGLGAGAPTASVSDGKLTVTAPGPIAGGTTYDMPAVRILLVADRPGTVTTAPGGSSWDDLGFAFTRLVVGESEYGPLQCYPDPAQPRTFTATTVTSR